MISSCVNSGFTLPSLPQTVQALCKHCYQRLQWRQPGCSPKCFHYPGTIRDESPSCQQYFHMLQSHDFRISVLKPCPAHCFVSISKVCPSFSAIEGNLFCDKVNKVQRVILFSGIFHRLLQQLVTDKRATTQWESGYGVVISLKSNPFTAFPHWEYGNVL